MVLKNFHTEARLMPGPGEAARVGLGRRNRIRAGTVVSAVDSVESFFTSRKTIRDGLVEITEITGDCAFVVQWRI